MELKVQNSGELPQNQEISEFQEEREMTIVQKLIKHCNFEEVQIEELINQELERRMFYKI